MLWLSADSKLLRHTAAAPAGIISFRPQQGGLSWGGGESEDAKLWTDEVFLIKQPAWPHCGQLAEQPVYPAYGLCPWFLVFTPCFPSTLSRFVSLLWTTMHFIFQPFAPWTICCHITSTAIQLSCCWNLICTNEPQSRGGEKHFSRFYLNSENVKMNGRKSNFMNKTLFWNVSVT